MNYQETIRYLFDSTPVFEHVGASAYKEGLTNSLALDKHFGYPHQHFKSVHIAGTNGKGSTAHTLASVLQENGYKVGLYTSPHLIDFRERIRINGIPVTEKYVIDFVENERSFFEPLHPSFFELTTAMAFKYFADNCVDIAVIEVGLGGKLDCTNIITPILSVITNISFDHTGFLGDTLEKIAREKAGIIKPHIPIIIGETTHETKSVFIEAAHKQQAMIRFAEEECELIACKENPNGGMLLTTKHYGELNFELQGVYQQKNAMTIFAATKMLQELGIINKPEAITNGFAKVNANTGLRGRWQLLKKRPTVICDTGHNVAGWQYISRQLKEQHYKVLRIVFGMVDDKDIKAVLALLPPEAHYYFTEASTKRAIPAKIIAQMATMHHLKGKVYTNVKKAYQEALADADIDDLIFIGGSNYIVADLLTASKDLY